MTKKVLIILVAILPFLWMGWIMLRGRISRVGREDGENRP